MAVTAITITSGPTIVGRSVTLSGTYTRDGGGTLNTINFLTYDAGYVNLYQVKQLSNNSALLDLSGTAGTGPWTWTGTLPDGTYLGVVIALNDSPYTTLAASTQVGTIALTGGLPGIWTPRRDARELFVPKASTYTSIYGAGTPAYNATGFFYPVRDGIYRSTTNSISKYGEYSFIAKSMPTRWGLGIDVPVNWQWHDNVVAGNSSWSTSGGTHMSVAVFSLHNASQYVNPGYYPAILGESRPNLANALDSFNYGFWRNSTGEQAILVNVGTGFGGSSFTINGVENGLHCLVVLVTPYGGAAGARIFFDGRLVATTQAPTYSTLLNMRPYYYWGSISQSHLNVGNVLLNAEAVNVSITDSAAAAISSNPYSFFFRDAPSQQTKLSKIFSFPREIQQTITRSTQVGGNVTALFVRGGITAANSGFAYTASVATQDSVLFAEKYSATSTGTAALDYSQQITTTPSYGRAAYAGVVLANIGSSDKPTRVKFLDSGGISIL
jgi:hypothetical protein